MGFWDQFWATVLGGLALAAALAALGWLIARVRSGIRPRPAFRLSKHPSGTWYLERIARKTAYDVQMSLGFEGRNISPNGGREALMDTQMERGHKMAMPNDREWSSVHINWRETPLTGAEAWLDDAQTSYDLVPYPRERFSLKRWLARLLA